MHFGISLPPFYDFCDARLLAKLARDAEEAGWEGFFIWDHILLDPPARPIADPWVALAAVAMNTERIKLGPMLTPLARRRPWKVARETVTLDRLSGGRVILGVGLGVPANYEFGFFHEEQNDKIRAEKLDEGLDILNGLWSGKPFRYEGKHYQLEEMAFLPPPAQSPRIPVWVGGYWPNKAPFRRAARWDGVCPGGRDRLLTPDDWRAIAAYIRQYRQTDAPFDMVHGGATPGDDPVKAAEIIQPFAEAGVTWWIEDGNPPRFMPPGDQPWTAESVERVKERIRQGPPRL